MTNNTNLAKIKELLISSRDIVILSHPSPDGDSIGSTMGLYLLLKAQGVSSAPVLPGPVPEVYNFLTKDTDILTPPVDIQDKTVVVLDCSDLQRLHQSGQNLEGAALVINIDHHLNNDMFGDYNYVESDAAAVGQIVYDMFSSEPCPDKAALALFTALYTDTGRFSYSNTRARTLDTAAKLVELGADPQYVYNQVFQARSPKYYSFLAAALSKMHLCCSNQVASISLDQEFLKKYDLEDWELEDMNDYPRSLQGVIVSAILRQVEDSKVKVSLRSKGQINVAEIARTLGGGGHLNAAGVTLNMPLAEAEALLLERIDKELGH